MYPQHFVSVTEMQKLAPRVPRFRTIQTPDVLYFPFPVHPQIRFAQLSNDAPAFGHLKPFRPASSIDLEGFHPNIVAGNTSELLQLVEQIDLGTANLSSVDHAVVVLTRCGQAPLNDVARVVLWQAFGVPVYEVFAGLDNAVLGYECELHEGWHLPPHVRFVDSGLELTLDTRGVVGLSTGISGFMTEDECPCGRTGRRLLDIQPAKRVNRETQRAAIA